MDREQRLHLGSKGNATGGGSRRVNVSFLTPSRPNPLPLPRIQTRLRIQPLHSVPGGMSARP